MEYEQLLKKAYKEIPQSSESTERFDIPKAQGHIQGSKTVVSNFTAMCSTLRREQEHLLKFLQRELATPAIIDGPRLVLGRKIASSLINEKIKQYAELFVLCPECKKPDTQLKKEDRITTIKCSACGAKHTVKAKI